MKHEIILHQNIIEVARQGLLAPAIIASADEETRYSFVEFFTAHIRNSNTREAYARQILSFFAWCDVHQLAELSRITSVHVAHYIEEINQTRAPASVKQALAAIRMMFDHLVRSRNPIQYNPAQAVRGPKLIVSEGKTPALSSDQVCDLVESIETDTIKGVRDRALVGTLFYSFGRISAVLGMNVGDYHQSGKRGMSVRLFEKGGKKHSVVAHHKLQEWLDTYLDVSGIVEEKRSPLFRTIGRDRKLTSTRLQRSEALRMLKRRAIAAGLPSDFSPHWCRATGITEFLNNGGKIEDAQKIAAHADPRTTKLYDRRGISIQQDEIERIRFERKV